MLEAFDKIENKNFKTSYNILTEECKKYPKLHELFRMYIVDEDNIITPMKIMKMMKYYQVEKGNDINNVGEIGEFAASRIKMLKIREFRWQQGNHLEVHMSNVEFLIDTYKKLKVDVQHKNQYKILKNCFLLLSPTDIKWFVRLLCRKIRTNKAMLEVIKDAQISSDM